MTETLNTVELRLAYEFTCDNCGRDTFLRCEALDPSSLTEDEFHQLYFDHGIAIDDLGDWTFQPEQVTCPHCDITFKVKGDDDDRPVDGNF